MHTSILKLTHIHSDPIQVPAKQLAIFREVKYKGWVH